MLDSTGAQVTRTSLNGLGANGDLTSVVASGSEYLVAGTADNNFVLAKALSTGALDSSFGTSGKVETAFSGNGAQATGLAVQSNGKIVVTGYEQEGSGHDFVALARYSSGGVLDSAFGTAGTTTLNLGDASKDSVGSGVLIQQDGKIEVAGYTSVGATPDNFFLARFVANNAPVAANSSAAFTTIDEGQTNNPGDSVATLISRLGGISDADGDSTALAITAADNTNGTWAYSTDNGASRRRSRRVSVIRTPSI